MATLGALFVLLALLIYHYKRQLNKLESKYDTMFEIINSLVKEVYKCKSEISESRMDRIQSVPNKTTPAYMLDHLVAGLPFSHNNIVNDSDSEEGSSIEGDDDEDDNDDDNDDDSDSESEQEPEYKQIYMAVEPEPIQEPVEEEKQEYKQIFLTSEPEKEPETIDVVLTELDVEEVVPMPAAKAVEEDNDDIISVLTSERRKPYSKMNMQELKQEVVFKGITTDISKMKKQDIVQLLRTHKQGESS
jgi:hypothetical protein